MTSLVANPRELSYTVMVVGESGAGKSNIIRRYVHNIFTENDKGTIGMDFTLKIIQWNENTVLRLHLCDVVATDRFRSILRPHYKIAAGAFIVFDSTKGATFEAVLKWKNDLDAGVRLAGGSPIPCVLLANKCDLDKGDGISQAEMKHFCETNNFHSWYFTSAKTNTNIDEAVRGLVKEIIFRQQFVKRQPASTLAGRTITLNNRVHGETFKMFGCC